MTTEDEVQEAIDKKLAEAKRGHPKDPNIWRKFSIGPQDPEPESKQEKVD
jgi:hypothetical protein